MHIWIWWHSLDGETCLISFQHATYLPQGRERYPISTDQYFQHADVRMSLLLEQNPCDPQNSRIIPFRERLMLAECLHFSICLFFCWKHFHWYVSRLTYGDVCVTLTARTQQLVILGTLFYHLWSIFFTASFNFNCNNHHFPFFFKKNDILIVNSRVIKTKPIWFLLTSQIRSSRERKRE